MGTTLTGTTPQDTYDSLIKVTDNGPISGTAKYLSDGLGNDSILALSTTAVGIGTTSPNVESGYGVLTFNGSTGGILDIKAAGTNVFRMYGTASASMVRTVTATPLLLGTTDLERMRITATGNVGIGTSAPYTSLTIGTSDATAEISSGGSNTHLTLKTVGASGALRFFTIGGGTSTLATTESMRITADGYMRMAASTGGIQFNGDTAAANALDDYEEGTWTMGVSFGGASVGVTYSQNTGTYTKIGRQVTVSGFLILTSKGSSTGAAVLTGLPFTIPNSNSNYSAATYWFTNVSFANQTQGNGSINNTVISFDEITEAGVTSSMTNTNFANNSGVIVSFTYFV